MMKLGRCVGCEERTYVMHGLCDACKEERDGVKKGIVRIVRSVESVTNDAHVQVVTRAGLEWGPLLMGAFHAALDRAVADGSYSFCGYRGAHAHAVAGARVSAIISEMKAAGFNVEIEDAPSDDPIIRMEEAAIDLRRKAGLLCVRLPVSVTTMPEAEALRDSIRTFDKAVRESG